MAHTSYNMMPSGNHQQQQQQQQHIHHSHHLHPSPFGTGPSGTYTSHSYAPAGLGGPHNSGDFISAGSGGFGMHGAASMNATGGTVGGFGMRGSDPGSLMPKPPSWDPLDVPDSPLGLKGGQVQIGGEELDVAMTFLADSPRQNTEGQAALDELNQLQQQGGSGLGSGDGGGGGNGGGLEDCLDVNFRMPSPSHSNSASALLDAPPNYLLMSMGSLGGMGDLAVTMDE